MTLGTEHDVHEFLTDTVFNLLHTCDFCPKIRQRITCVTCNKSRFESDEDCPCIILTVPHCSVNTVSVQNLINEYTLKDVAVADCDSDVCAATSQRKHSGCSRTLRNSYSDKTIQKSSHVICEKQCSCTIEQNGDD